MAQVTPGMKFQATRSDVKTESSLGTAKQNTRTKYWAIEDIQDLSNVAVTAGSLVAAGNLSAANRFILATEEVTGSTGTVDLHKTVSYFTIAANASETSTLAAGQNGQIKVLVVKSCGANGTHQVSLAGSGVQTVTFNGNNDSCILVYIDDRWKLIAAGDFAVTFA